MAVGSKIRVTYIESSTGNLCIRRVVLLAGPKKISPSVQTL